MARAGSLHKTSPRAPSSARRAPARAHTDSHASAGSQRGGEWGRARARGPDGGGDRDVDRALRRGARAHAQAQVLLARGEREGAAPLPLAAGRAHDHLARQRAVVPVQRRAAQARCTGLRVRGSPTLPYHISGPPWARRRALCRHALCGPCRSAALMARRRAARGVAAGVSRTSCLHHWRIGDGTPALQPAEMQQEAGAPARAQGPRTARWAPGAARSGARRRRRPGRPGRACPAASPRWCRLSGCP